MRKVRHLSLRLRLTLACTAVAAVVGAAGLGLFDTLLHRGVAASVDTVLAVRSSRAVTDFRRTGQSELQGGAAPQAPVGNGGRDEADSLSAVYGPTGAVVSSSPPGAGRGLLDADQLGDARAGALHLTVVSTGGEPLRVLAVPVQRSGRTWVVAVATSLVPPTAAADRAVSDLYIGLPVLVAMVALGAWVLAGAALRPVERMRSDAEGLLDSGSAVDALTVPVSPVELARLGRTFNRLLQRLQQSLARQRDLVADTGHELRTPLTVLRTELELADSAERSREELADSIHHARREVERLTKLAEDMLFLARADSDVPLVHVQPVDVVAVLSEAERANRARAESLGVALETDLPDRLVVPADHQALRRAVDNLVANALAVVPAGGRIRIAAGLHGDTASICVSDDGPGFPPGFEDRAFERFSRPESARPSERGGAGLGLAIVAEIARALNGRVSAGRSDSGGAEVALELPAVPPSGSGPSPAGSPAGRRPGLRDPGGSG